MSIENPTRKNASRLDLAVFVVSVCVVSMLSFPATSTSSSPSLEREQKAEAKRTLCRAAPEVQKVVLERDPWANPILSCSLVAPGEFGYDQRRIYRLPGEQKCEWQAPENGLRDPMANLLLQDEGPG